MSGPGQPRRPAPPDFVEVAAAMARHALREHYRVGPNTLERWIHETGARTIGDRRKDQAIKRPDDFAERAVSSTNAALAREYGVSDGTVAKWRREVGLDPLFVWKKGAVLRTLPDSFAEQCRTKTRAQLADFYRTSLNMITRWTKESGVQPVVRRRGTRLPVERGLACVMDSRDGSEASRAQSFLQRFYPVWRCNPDGTFNPKGSHFRCDGITRTQEEMIERARRKGWNPDAWRLAA